MKKLFLSVALALSLILSSQSVAYAFQQSAPIQANANTEESILGFAASDGSALTPTGVFNAMIALKDQDGYREGTTWTDIRKELHGRTMSLIQIQQDITDGKAVLLMDTISLP